MKILRKISAAAVSAVLAASMVISASAATYQDAVQAAKDAGVQAINVQELENFLSANSDYFKSEDYDYMISVINGVRDKYVTPLAKELFNKTPGELTEDEKIQLGQHWSKDDRAAIIKALTDLGDKYDVEIDVDQLTRSDYTVAASIKRPTDSSNSNGGSESKAGGTQIVVTDPVANTGEIAENDAEAGTVAFAGLALLLAATGIVVVAKKNKAE